MKGRLAGGAIQVSVFRALQKIDTMGNEIWAVEYNVLNP